jgi:thioredoxin
LRHLPPTAFCASHQALLKFFSTAVPSDFMETIMSEILHINDETFDQTVNSDTTVFVDFWAPWCGPCRMLAPRLEQAAETFDGRAVIAKYNCDEASDKAAQYGVRGIPTVIAFKKGEVIDQRTGACDQATLDAFIEKNL